MTGRWTIWVLAAIIITAVMGCVPYADQPLTDPGQGPVDTAILGTWFWNEDSENGFVHIGTNEAGNRLRLLMVTLYRDGELEVAEFAGHPSLIGGNTYLNLKSVRPVAGVPEGFFFLKVIPSATSLGFAFMEPDAIEKAIQAGTLQGQVGQTGKPLAIHITDDRARLRDFILRHDKVLYATVKVLPRLALPGSAR